MFHDEGGKGVSKFELNGGDDASLARWRMVHRGLSLFASHYEFMEKVALELDAYW
jgi:transient receptor potential cation channel subfamily M protein 2